MDLHHLRLSKGLTFPGTPLRVGIAHQPGGISLLAPILESTLFTRGSVHVAIEVALPIVSFC
jgi:hypothetical protein